MTCSDFIVIGGGIIGISIARALQKTFHGAKVVLLEKESDCGLHASGRNSGVLHAGFYYSADSLKARFTREGNRLLTQYCETRNIAINKCGKLVVTQSDRDLPRLDELLQRGRKNQVLLHAITASEARAIEPRVKTHERAIFSPTTASVDPGQVMQSLKNDAVREGVEIRFATRYLKRTASGVQTSSGVLQARYIVNSAGLYADQIGRDFGFSQHHGILPFKGFYLYGDDPAGTLHTHVYPVPDPQFPFLGVHFTLTADGKTKIGPTAIPAFWREQYSGLDNFDPREFLDLTLRQLGLLAFSNFDFKKLAVEEFKKYSRSRLVARASSLLDGVQAGHFTRWGKPGIRAQLVDLKTKKLEMDFVLQGDGESMHVLNAVSPGFTCALPFAEYICDEIRRRFPG